MGEALLKSDGDALNELLSALLKEVISEYHSGRQKHGYFNSDQELWAVIYGELDEFWDSVKAHNPDDKELIQIAATAIAGVVWLRCGLNRIE